MTRLVCLVLLLLTITTVLFAMNSKNNTTDIQFRPMIRTTPAVSRTNHYNVWSLTNRETWKSHKKINFLLYNDRHCSAKSEHAFHNLKQLAIKNGLVAPISNTKCLGYGEYDCNPICNKGDWLGEFHNAYENKKREDLSFLASYRFVLVFEHTKDKMVVSKQLFDAFAAQTIPIYFRTDFTETNKIINPLAYIKYDEKKPKNTMNKIIELLNSETEFERIVRQPVFMSGKNSVQSFLSSRRLSNTLTSLNFDPAVPKVVIVMSDTRDIHNYKKTHRDYHRVVATNAEFAKRHGYDFTFYLWNCLENTGSKKFCEACGFPGETLRAPSWCKLLALQHALKQTPTNSIVLYLDSDAIINDPKQSVVKFLELFESRRPLALFNDAPHSYRAFNCGVIFARNTNITRVILENWWNVGKKAAHHFMSHPFEQSQVNKPYIARDQYNDYFDLIGHTTMLMDKQQFPKQFVFHASGHKSIEKQFNNMFTNQSVDYVNKYLKGIKSLSIESISKNKAYE